MKLLSLAAISLMSACVATDEPELDSTQQELTGSQIATLNQIGKAVGLDFSWTDATRTAPAHLQENLRPISGVARDTNATQLDGGFEHHFHIDQGAIDPCWLTEIGASGMAPVVSVKSLRGASGYGTALFTVAGTNYTIQGTASAADPTQPNFTLQFVVLDAAGNIVFDSRR